MRDSNKSFDCVKHIICEVLKTHIQYDASIEYDDCCSDNLFGNKLNISPKSMLYLFHLLETNFSIRFTDDDVDSERFYTINGLAEIIAEKLQ